MQNYKTKRLAASAQINGTASLILTGVLLSAAAANVTCKIFEAADGSGTPIASFAVLTGDSRLFDLSKHALGMTQGYCTLAGVGVEATLFFE